MKPILFSTEMVKALLNTKPDVWPAEPIDAAKPFKSQTRRVIKPQPLLKGSFWELGGAGWSDNITSVEPVPCHSLYNRMPYKPGDILYVRETWADIPETAPGNLHYRASASDGDIEWFRKNNRKWKPSIFMPREYARLFLEVKSARVERVNDITEEDAKAEGVSPMDPLDLWKAPLSILGFSMDGRATYRATSFTASYYQLWNSLNAKRGYSWDSNPWVWVYEFGRVER